MAYLLRKTQKEKGLYLQIYFNSFDKEYGYVRSKCYKSLGYEKELKEKGQKDPIADANRLIAELNKKFRNEKEENKRNARIKKTGARREFNYGYLMLKSLVDKLNYSREIDLITASKFPFKISKILNCLIYARVVEPLSKSDTYSEVIPALVSEEIDFNLENIYSLLEYVGANYDRFIYILNKSILKHFKRDTERVYFDCTNFYFEIDKEDELRKKGPSKENRMNPITSMGILLDKNCIPLSMRIFPGNESEKPVIRRIISEMKNNGQIQGKTIQIADKGLNCGQNIIEAMQNGDGYIFSQSLKRLGKKELDEIFEKYKLCPNEYSDSEYSYREWIQDVSYNYMTSSNENERVTIRQKRILTFSSKLQRKQLFEINKRVEKAAFATANQMKKSELGSCSRYVVFETQNKNGEILNGKIVSKLNEEMIELDRKLAGYNMLITSELEATGQEIYEAYHSLWTIEESFKILKSELDARPIYLQKPNSIKGHFVICYFALVLLRILQYEVFENSLCTSQIVDLIRSLRVVLFEKNKYANMLDSTTKHRDAIIKIFPNIDKYDFRKSDLKTLFN